MRLARMLVPVSWQALKLLVTRLLACFNELQPVLFQSLFLLFSLLRLLCGHFNLPVWLTFALLHFDAKILSALPKLVSTH